MPIMALAAALRCVGIDATFESSDQVAMPLMLRHGFGIRWILAHDYGPVAPLLQRLFATIWCGLGGALDETASRLPIAMASLLQVAVTFPLMRRLGRSENEAMLGMLVAAILPTLVTDGHYAWGYLTLWLLTGTIALWATLAWLDDRRSWQMALSIFALAAHCLSNCYALALPLTLLIVWLAAITRHHFAVRHAAGSCALPAEKRKLVRAAVMGYVLPCVVAIGIIAISWRWTGGSQIAHLLRKQNAGTTGLHLHQLLALPAFWSQQFGYLFAIISAAGVIWAVFNRNRIRFLCIWTWMSVGPMVLLTDWSRIGFAGAYLIEAVYPAGLLGVILVSEIHRRLRYHRPIRTALSAVTVLALIHMAFASYDACLAGSRFQTWTGAQTGWGVVRPDTGIKASGWYVRRHVPASAVILPVHTRDGMEVTVSEYYLGRRVLATYDLPETAVAPLLGEMQARAGVIIVDVRHKELVASLPAFERVCTVHLDGRPVRFIYGRPELGLPVLDGNTGEWNDCYDRDFTVRSIPLALPAPAGFEEHFAMFQAAARKLKQGLAAPESVSP